MIKWFVLATFIGGIVGVADAVFLFVLDSATGYTAGFPLHFVFLSLIFMVTGYLSKKVVPSQQDYTTDAVIHKINSNRSVGMVSVLKAFVLPVITIAGGGSAGKEAPCADVGAGLASFTANVFKLNKADRRKLMICGVSAGFAGVFGVPVSGAIFGLEVLWVGHIFYEVMFPAFIAGITAFQVTSFLGVEYMYHPMNFAPILAEGFFIKVVFAGVVFGLVSVLFIEIMKFCKILFRYIGAKYSFFWRAFIGGSILVAIGLLLSPEYLGLGMENIEAALSGAEGSPFASPVKMITSAITVTAGGVGGIVTPVFFIGAEAGSTLAAFLEVDPATMAALGLVAVLAGTTNTPLASSIMAIELFGSTITPYAAVACVISFLITGERSLFGRQKVTFIKDLEYDAGQHGGVPAAMSQPKKLRSRKASILKLVRHLIPDARAAKRKKK